MAMEKYPEAEVVHGAKDCHDHSMKLLSELGFPGGVLPLTNLEECGMVHETGFVWMKQKVPYEHLFRSTNTLVRYDTEVTAYVEKGKMKKMKGVKSKQLLVWVPIVEMSIEEEKIYFKSNLGIGKTYPASTFIDEKSDKEDKEEIEDNNSFERKLTV